MRPSEKDAGVVGAYAPPPPAVFSSFTRAVAQPRSIHELAGDRPEISELDDDMRGSVVGGNGRVFREGGMLSPSLASTKAASPRERSWIKSWGSWGLPSTSRI
jgi:hypothetical protein